MAKSKYATTGGNDYEDSAQGAKRWGTKNGFNNTHASTGADSRNGRTAERPSSGQSKSYSSLSDAEQDRPDIPFKSWR